jgi:ATP-grasp domain, R2K clade family 3
MHWIIQENLFHEAGLIALIESLQRLDLRYDVVKVIPFSHQLEPDVQPTGPVIVMGSTTLSAIAVQRGWQPGSFLNDNHDMRIWIPHYGVRLLNATARICRFADVEPLWEPFFIRPCGDTKQFAGAVMAWAEFAEWRDKVINLKDTYTSLDASTSVCYAPTHDIAAEYRFFIIDGRIVTQSLYKRGNRVIYAVDVEPAVIAFTQQMIDLWCPARGFVIDVALTDDGYRIIEINCLNSAGFYAADVRRLVEAIEAM